MPFGFTWGNSRARPRTNNNDGSGGSRNGDDFGGGSGNGEQFSAVVQRLRRLTVDQQASLLSSMPELTQTLSQLLDGWDESEQEQLSQLDDVLRPQCTCRRCSVVAAAGEDVCCQRDVQNCITLEPFFVQNVLDREALLVAMRQRNVYWGTRDDGSEPKQFRYQAYRTFTFWQYGYLGRSVRVACPSCVYKAIRTAYPDPNGVYVHFRTAEDMDEFLRYQ